MTRFVSVPPMAAWALALALAASSTARAQTPSPGLSAPPKGQAGGERGARAFQMIDANKDGAISREEFAAFQAQRFTRLDANKDGVVTREEFSAAPAGRAAKQQATQPGNQASPPADRLRENRERRFKAMDKDGDGKLSLAEHRAGMSFDQFDRNKDGKLTADEMPVLREERLRR